MLLLNKATATGPGPSIAVRTPARSFQVTVQGTGVLSAAVNVEVSNNNVNFLLLGAVTVSDTVPSDGFAVSAEWNYVRANLTAISGTGATVTCILGVQ